MSPTDRPDWHTYFLLIAKAIALRSSCPRLSVGAVLVKNHRIVSTGYNGAPPGAEDCLEGGCVLVESSCKRVLHAEANVLFYAPKAEVPGSTLYLTHSPCMPCASLLHAYGVQKVYFDELFKNDLTPIEALYRSGIPSFQKGPEPGSPYELLSFPPEDRSSPSGS